MWTLIYRTVRLGFSVAIALAAAVVLSVVIGGPFLLWLAVIAVAAAGLYLAWPRIQQYVIERPFEAQFAQPQLAQPQLAQPQLVPQTTASASIAALPAESSLTATQPITSSAITATLPQPSTRTAAGALGGSWTNFVNTLSDDEVTASPTHFSFWTFTRQQVLFFLALGFTALVAIGLRAYQLSTLQAEIYGDINIIHDYVSWIRNGDFPLRFSLSTGPLYHYLLMPFVWLLGATYDTYKVVSVLISLTGIAVTYLASRRLLFALEAQPFTATTQRRSDWFAVLVAFVMSVSSWFLVFSRLGNSQILVPLLVVLALWLLLRFVQDDDRKSLIWCGIASALGLYVYPQSFVLPVAIALVLGLFKIAPRTELTKLAPLRANRPITWTNLLLFCGVVLLCAVPFPLVIANSTSAINNYIAPKLGAAHPLNILVTNIINTALSYHVIGDETFRSNPPNLPHLDLISGLFMLIGFVLWFRRSRLTWLALLILFIILQVPSMLVLIEPVETPSASRTLGAAPIAYLYVASGIWWLLNWLRARASVDTSRQPPAASSALLAVGLILVAILGLNADRYFNRYIGNLPYNNTPIAKDIIDYVNMLPPTTQVYMSGCCWERGMPEPKGIGYEIKHPENWHYISRPDTLTCEQVKQYPAGSVMIWNYKMPTPTTSLLTCQELFEPQVYSSANGKPIFHATTLWGGPILAANPPASGTTSADDAAGGAAQVSPITNPPPAASSATELLNLATVQLDGEPVRILYPNLDMGDINAVADQNLQTLMRGAGANPFILQLEFETPRDLSGIAVTVGTMTDVKFTAAFIKADDATTESVTVESTTLPPDPRVELSLPGGTQSIKAIRIEILDRRQPPQEGFHTHIREIEVLP